MMQNQILLYVILLICLNVSISCPNWCNNRGYCTSPLEGGYCVCQNGYSGDDCSIKICPKAFEPLTLASKPNRRTIRIKTGSLSGYLSGGFIFSFGNGEAFLNANASIADDSICTRTLMQMDTVAEVTCKRESIDEKTGGAIYEVSLDSYPMIPKENNLFFHSGNPHSSAFKCNTSMIHSDIKGPYCFIEDVILPDLPSYLECAGHGICDKITGSCNCEKGFKGLDCSDNTDSSDIYVQSHDGPYFSGSLLKLNIDRTLSPVFNILNAKINGDTVTTIRGDKLLTHNGNTNLLGDLVLGEMNLNTTKANVYSNMLKSTNLFHFKAISDDEEVFNIRKSGDVYIKGTIQVDDSSLHVSKGITTVKNIIINENLEVSGKSTIRGDVKIGGSITVNSESSSNHTLINLDSSGTGSFLKASTQGRELFDLSSQGFLTLQSMHLKSGGVSIDAGGLQIGSGGAIINGGLTVKSGGLIIPDQDMIVKTLEAISIDANVAKPLVSASTKGSNYVGNMIELKSNSSSNFNFLSATGTNGEEKLLISNDGSIQSSGGISISKDLIVSKHSSLKGGLSLSKKSLSAGETIKVTNDISYLEILDDDTNASNDLQLPTNDVSIGKILIITNNDSQSTKGSIIIPAGATVLILYDGKKWIDIEALHAPIEHLKNVKTFECSNDINIGNYTLTIGRLKALRMQKGSIPVVAAGGYLLDSDKFTFSKGTLNSPAIKTKAIVSDIDVLGNTLSNAILSNAKIIDNSIIIAKDITINNKKGLAYFSDIGQLQSTSSVSFDNDGNIIINKISSDVDMSGYKFSNGSFNNIDNINTNTINANTINANTISIEDMKSSKIQGFTLLGDINGNRNSINNINIKNGIIDNIDSLNVKGTVTFTSLSSSSSLKEKMLILSDENGQLSSSNININSNNGKIDAKYIDFTNHKDNNDDNLNVNTISSNTITGKTITINDKANFNSDIDCKGTISAQSASLSSMKISGLIESQSALLSSLKISNDLDVSSLSIKSLTKTLSPLDAKILSADNDGTIHTIQLDDIPTKIQKNLKLESLYVDGKVQLDSLYFKKGNNNVGKKSLLQIDNDGEISYIEKGDDIELDKLLISKELKVNDIKVMSLIENTDSVGLIHSDKNGNIVTSNVIRLDGKDKDTIVTIKSSKLNVIGGVDVNGPMFVDDSLQVRGTVMGSGPYLDSSDKRLKKDIQPFQGSLESINKLQAVTYLNNIEEYSHYFPNTITNRDQRQIGWIADEVEKILPELVSEDSNGYKAVAYSRSVSVIAEAVKELQQITNAQLVSLQEQIIKLQEQINSCKCSN